MQNNLDWIELYPEADQLLSALCMFGREPTLLEQVENRVGHEINLENLAFLLEHLYIVQLTDGSYQITNKGWSYLNNRQPKDPTLL